MVSLGTILYIIIRTLPRLDDEPVKRGVMERWLTSELPAKLDASIHGTYLRTLRRLKVFVLKADNSLNKKLESIKLDREPIKGERINLEDIKDKTPEEIGEETGTE